MKAGLTPRGMCCVKRAIGRAGKSHFRKTAQQSQVRCAAHYLFCDPYGRTTKDQVRQRLSCARKSMQTSQSNPRRYRPHRDSPVGLSDMARYATCPAIQRGSSESSLVPLHCNAFAGAWKQKGVELPVRTPVRLLKRTPFRPGTRRKAIANQTKTKRGDVGLAPDPAPRQL